MLSLNILEGLPNVVTYLCIFSVHSGCVQNWHIECLESMTEIQSKLATFRLPQQ